MVLRVEICGGELDSPTRNKKIISIHYRDSFPKTLFVNRSEYSVTLMEGAMVRDRQRIFNFSREH